MAALREILVAFGIEVNTKPLTDAEQKTNSFKNKLGQVAGVVAAAFAVDKVTDFVFGMVRAADAVGDQAARLNLSTRALEEWSYAAKFADLEAGELNGVFDKLARTSNAATDASSEQGQRIKKLGVDVKDANGQLKDTGVLFEEIGLALAGLDNETERTALSFEFFGKTAGPKVLQLFKEGPEGIAKFRAEFEALGGGFGDFIEEAGKIDDQMHRLDLAWVSAKTKIVGLLLPALLTLAQGVTRAVSFFTKLARETNIVQSVMITLGAVAVGLGIKVLAAWGPVLLITAAWAAAIALVALAIEDVVTFFQGGDSLIGRAIDAWFGEGSQEKVRQWGKDLYNACALFLSGALSTALDTILALLDLVGLAFADNAEEVDYWADRFFTHSAGISNAIDGLIEKLAFLKTMFSWDNLTSGVNSALDAVEMGLESAGIGESSVTREAKAKAAVRAALKPKDTISAPAGSDAAKWGYGATQVEAPIIQNFTLPPGTPNAVRQAATEGAGRGAQTGMNRAAAAAFDKRGRK